MHFDQGGQNVSGINAQCPRDRRELSTVGVERLTQSACEGVEGVWKRDA